MESVVNLDNIKELLYFYAISDRNSKNFLNKNLEKEKYTSLIQETCIELFKRDYNIGIISNQQGEYCETYPEKIVILESEKKEEDKRKRGRKNEKNKNVTFETLRQKIFNIKKDKEKEKNEEEKDMMMMVRNIKRKNSSEDEDEEDNDIITKGYLSPKKTQKNSFWNERRNSVLNSIVEINTINDNSNSNSNDTSDTNNTNNTNNNNNDNNDNNSNIISNNNNNDNNNNNSNNNNININSSNNSNRNNNNFNKNNISSYASSLLHTNLTNKSVTWNNDFITTGHEGSKKEITGDTNFDNNSYDKVINDNNSCSFSFISYDTNFNMLKPLDEEESGIDKIHSYQNKNKNIPKSNINQNKFNATISNTKNPFSPLDQSYDQISNSSIMNSNFPIKNKNKGYTATLSNRKNRSYSNSSNISFNFNFKPDHDHDQNKNNYLTSYSDEIPFVMDDVSMEYNSDEVNEFYSDNKPYFNDQFKPTTRNSLLNDSFSQDNNNDIINVDDDIDANDVNDIDYENDDNDNNIKNQLNNDSTLNNNTILSLSDTNSMPIDIKSSSTNNNNNNNNNNLSDWSLAQIKTSLSNLSIDNINNIIDNDDNNVDNDNNNNISNNNTNNSDHSKKYNTNKKKHKNNSLLKKSNVFKPTIQSNESNIHRNSSETSLNLILENKPLKALLDYNLYNPTMDSYNKKEPYSPDFDSEDVLDDLQYSIYDDDLSKDSSPLSTEDNPVNIEKNEMASLPPHIPESNELKKLKPFNNTEELKLLFMKSKLARVRSRFVIPVILYKNKNICRSGTLSLEPEILLNTLNSKTKQMIYGISSDNPETETSFRKSIIQYRQFDIELLNKLKIRNIADLMVETKKIKYGLTVSSSEKCEPNDQYRKSGMNLIVVPYPGSEFFRNFKLRHFCAKNLEVDWTSSIINSELSFPLCDQNYLNIDWNQYKSWNFIKLTQNYMKLFISLLQQKSNNNNNNDPGLLVHCISGWDRTPLFISLIRISLWADGEIHTSLNPEELLYLTIGYDWFSFCHLLSDRMTRGEVVFDFCFYFLYFITNFEYSASYLSNFTIQKNNIDKINDVNIHNKNINDNNNTIYNSLNINLDNHINKNIIDKNDNVNNNNNNNNINIKINDTQIQTQTQSLISKLPNFNITKTLKSPFSLLTMNTFKTEESKGVSSSSLLPESSSSTNVNNSSWTYISSSSCKPSPSQISINEMDNENDFNSHHSNHDPDLDTVDHDQVSINSVKISDNMSMSYVPVSNSFTLSDFEDNAINIEPRTNKEKDSNSIYSISNTNSNIGDFSFVDSFSVKSSISNNNNANNKLIDLNRNSLSLSNKSQLSSDRSKSLINYTQNNDGENIKDFSLISPSSLDVNRIAINPKILKNDLSTALVDSTLQNINSNSNTNANSKALVEVKRDRIPNSNDLNETSMDRNINPNNNYPKNESVNSNERDKDLIFPLSFDSQKKRIPCSINVNVENKTTMSLNDPNDNYSLTSPLIFSLDMNTMETKDTNTMNFMDPNNRYYSLPTHYSRQPNTHFTEFFNSYQMPKQIHKNFSYSPSPKDKKSLISTSINNNIILEENTSHSHHHSNNISPQSPYPFSLSPNPHLHFQPNELTSTSTSAPTISYFNTQNSPSSSSSSSTFSNSYNQYRIRRNSQTNLDVLRFRNHMSYNSRLTDRNYINPTTPYYSIKSYYEGRKLSHGNESNNSRTSSASSPSHQDISFKSSSKASSNKTLTVTKSPISNKTLSFNTTLINESLSDHENNLKEKNIRNKKFYQLRRSKLKRTISNTKRLLKDKNGAYTINRLTVDIIKRQPHYYDKEKRSLLSKKLLVHNNYNETMNPKTVTNYIIKEGNIKRFNDTIKTFIDSLNINNKDLLQKINMIFSFKENFIHNKIQQYCHKKSEFKKILTKPVNALEKTFKMINTNEEMKKLNESNNNHKIDFNNNNNKNDNNKIDFNNNNNNINNNDNDDNNNDNKIDFNNNNNNNNIIDNNNDNNNNCINKKTDQKISRTLSYELICPNTKIPNTCKNNKNDIHLWTCSCCSDIPSESNDLKSKKEALYYYRIIYGLSKDMDDNCLPSYLLKNFSYKTKNNNNSNYSNDYQEKFIEKDPVQIKKKLREYRLKAVRQLFLEARLWALNQENYKTPHKETRW